MVNDDSNETASPGAIASDESLVVLARTGDRTAFAALWQRHSRSGLRVARQFTSSIDADDLVSEAYARIYQRVLAGGGPDGAFRPYLYTTIRNLASRWGNDRRDVNVDDIGEFEDPAAGDDPAAAALDRTLTVRAFRTLPDRWQSVLWYTEVEGMDPHEVAPILGLTANGVAALSYRAREGLRKAWLQAHVSEASASGECQWSIARLGDYARSGMTARDRTRVSDHLATCLRCEIISEEVDDVGSRLALVMLPLLLGGIAGGGLLVSLGTPASVAAGALTPALPPTFAVSAGVLATPTVAVGLTATAITAPLIGALAMALGVFGGLAASNSTPADPAPASTSIARLSHAVDAPSVPVVRLSVSATGSVDAPRAALDPATNSLPPLTGPLRSTVNNTVNDTVNDTVNNTVSGVGTLVSGLVTDLTNPVNSLLPGLTVATGAIRVGTAPSGPDGVTTALGLTVTTVPGATVITLDLRPTVLSNSLGVSVEALGR